MSGVCETGVCWGSLRMRMYEASIAMGGGPTWGIHEISLEDMLPPKTTKI